MKNVRITKDEHVVCEIDDNTTITLSLYDALDIHFALREYVKRHNIVKRMADKTESGTVTHDTITDNTKIEDAGLTNKAYNALKRAINIMYVKQLANMTIVKLQHIHSCGKSTIMDIAKTMRALGYDPYKDTDYVVVKLSADTDCLRDTVGNIIHPARFDGYALCLNLNPVRHRLNEHLEHSKMIVIAFTSGKKIYKIPDVNKKQTYITGYITQLITGHDDDDAFCQFRTIAKDATDTLQLTRSQHNEIN